jgi:hypothetical protein
LTQPTVIEGLSCWALYYYSKDTPYNDQRANTIFMRLHVRVVKIRVGKYEMNSKPMKDTKPNSILK